MTELLAFIDTHPWWTFFYLLVLCGGLRRLINFMITLGKSSSKEAA